MKTLSVRQPWAWAIVAGVKQVENRTWPTAYRGPLLIHASRGRAEFLPERDFAGLLPGLPPIASLSFGAIVGRVRLVACVPRAEVGDDPFATGPWCWLLEDAEAFTVPIPYRGALWLFDVPEEIIRPPGPG